MNLKLEMSFKPVKIEEHQLLSPGWYLDVAERLVADGEDAVGSGSFRTTRYGPMPLEFMGAVRDDLIQSAEQAVADAVENLKRSILP